MNKKDEQLIQDFLTNLLPEEEHPSLPDYSQLKKPVTLWFHELRYELFCRACKDLHLSRMTMFNSMFDRVIIGAYGMDTYKEMRKVILADAAARQKNKKLRYVDKK